VTVPQEQPDRQTFAQPQSLGGKGPQLLTIAALLPPRLLTQVRHALAGEREILAAESWHELERLIKKTALRAVIIDPEANGMVDSASVVRLLTRYPSLPIIAYVTLGPATFSGIAHLSRLGLEHVILHRFDDSVERFRRTVDSVGSDPMVREVVDALRPSLGRLPLPLAMSVQQMFDEPQRFITALDLSSSCGMPTVRMYQSFAQADITSPKNLLIAARALRAFSYLRDPGYSVNDVALKLGYLQARILGNHVLKVFGLKPARARRRMSESEAVDRVLGFVRGFEAEAI
jgi:AraC-like DNA-binding protein